VTLSSPQHAHPPAGHDLDASLAGLDLAIQKLKLLEFGLYGLQQYGRNAPVDVEDLGPFYRLAEEIASDLHALRSRQRPLGNLDG
jgi:hypothetical protein